MVCRAELRLDSNENAAVWDPKRIATVALERRVDFSPCASWHRIVVSEVQLVRSQAVRPSLVFTDISPFPALAPINVTLTDPVEAEFLRTRTLARIKSMEPVCDCVPTRAPMLKENSLLPIVPSGAEHLMDVSDSQVDCSHAVCFNRTEAVCNSTPIPPP